MTGLFDTGWLKHELTFGTSAFRRTVDSPSVFQRIRRLGQHP